MAISVDKVKKIQTQTIDLGELIVSINPVTDKEWDAFEKLVAAHKSLMKIETDALLQLPLLPEPKAIKILGARKDCPRCQGAGSVIDLLQPGLPSRPCTCKDVPNTDWPKVKQEWKEALAPAEA